MLGILLIAVGLWVLFGDPSVKKVKGGINKTEAVAKGVRDVCKGRTGAPKPSEDLLGWLFYKG